MYGQPQEVNFPTLRLHKAKQNVKLFQEMTIQSELPNHIRCYYDHNFFSSSIVVIAVMTTYIIIIIINVIIILLL